MHVREDHDGAVSCRGCWLSSALDANVSNSIVGRALQGIGGAGLYSLAQICLIGLGLGGPETVGAMVGITLSVSYVLGPLLGGVISSRWMWQGIFLIK